MLRRREVLGFTLVAMIVVWPFTLSGADMKLQEPKSPLAHLEVASGRVDWLPEVNERLVLTVAGPEDFFLRREFEPGQTPYLSLADSKGNPMPDGSYAYELRVLQRLPEKLTKVPPVQSGFLSVQGGSFVDLSRQSKPAPKPPFLPTKDITVNDDLVVVGQDGPVLTLKGDIATLLQIKFDNTDCCHPSTRDWALQANDFGNSTGDFLFRDLSAGTIPFRIGSGVPNDALTISSSIGNVGLGTLTPATQLHVIGSDAGSRNKILVENTGSTNFREMLEMRNNGSPVFILKDTSVAQRWGIGTLGSSLVLDEQAHTGVEYTFTNTGNLTIAGTLTQGSSRDLKTDFTSLDPKEVLARVSALPVSLWSYKTENAVRHVGPMAEDFHQAFGLGADDKHIAPGDQAGVALLAVQGLDQLLQSKGREIATLQHENADLAKRVEALEVMLSKVMSAKAAPDEQAP
jgi:hypothetical protein